MSSDGVEADELGEIAVTSPDYAWTDDPDEQRRCFIFQHMASAEIDGNVLVKNMQMMSEWLKTGDMPKPITPRGRPLNVVKAGE